MRNNQQPNQYYGKKLSYLANSPEKSSPPSVKTQPISSQGKLKEERQF